MAKSRAAREVLRDPGPVPGRLGWLGRPRRKRVALKETRAREKRWSKGRQEDGCAMIAKKEDEARQ